MNFLRLVNFEFARTVIFKYYGIQILYISCFKTFQVRGRLMEFEAHNYFKQLTSAVLYLHNLKISHRDLKCENIMINENDEVKIVDFGFCARPGKTFKWYVLKLLCINCHLHKLFTIRFKSNNHICVSPVHIFFYENMYSGQAVLQNLCYKIL